MSLDCSNAIGAGIWSEAARFTQQPSSPSGNCKWENYPSTGWCSKCQNATSYAKITGCEPATALFDYRLNNTDSCFVDFGHGDKIQVLSPFEHYSRIVKNVVWPLGLLNNDLFRPLSNQTYAGVTNPIIALGNVQLQLCNKMDLHKGLCITHAEECVLSLCTKQLETSVVNGTTETKANNGDFGCMSQVHRDGGFVLQEVPGTHCWQAGRLCDDLHFTNLSSENYSGSNYCSDGISFLEFERHKSSPTLQNKLVSRLTGNRTSRWIYDGIGSFEGEATIASSLTMDYVTAQGLKPVLAGVAASLTRQALFANTSEEYMGTVWTTETYVAVNWPWLIFPAKLVLGAIVLLALTAIHSRRCRLKIWKGSILPLLYRTVDPELLARQPVLHDLSMMAVAAGRAKVTLVEISREDRVVLSQ